MGLNVDPNKKGRYTDEEVAELSKWSLTGLITKNRRRYPADGDPADPDVTPQSERNTLLGGEGEEGHPDRNVPTLPQVNGFDDAPADVQADIEPLNVARLKEELDALEVEYDASLNKAELRDLLAVEWAKVS